jgi:hypothetical protein
MLLVRIVAIEPSRCRVAFGTTLMAASIHLVLILYLGCTLLRAPWSMLLIRNVMIEPSECRVAFGTTTMVASILLVLILYLGWLHLKEMILRMS